MGDPPASAAQLLTVADLAHLLQVSVRTVWRMRREAAIPAPLRIRGAVRWHRHDIDHWLLAGCPRSAVTPNITK